MKKDDYMLSFASIFVISAIISIVVGWGVMEVTHDVNVIPPEEHGLDGLTATLMNLVITAPYTLPYFLGSMVVLLLWNGGVYLVSKL